MHKHADGQYEVYMRVLEPVLVDQERLCANQSVTVECHFPRGAGVVIWATFGQDGPLTYPNNALKLPSYTMIGDTKNSSDGKFIATLTARSSDNLEKPLFTSTLTIQPPLDSLNGTILICDAGYPSNKTDLTLYGKCLCVLL